MLTFLVFFFILLSNLSYCTQENSPLLVHLDKTAQQALTQIYSYTGPKTYFLSYPRCGNTWLRYCIEYLTGRSTIRYDVDLKNIIPVIFNPKGLPDETLRRMATSDTPVIPIAWVAGFEIDPAKAPIGKVHNRKELRASGYNPQNDSLIFILRNPKETVFKHKATMTNFDQIQRNETPGSIEQYIPADYFDNIAIYQAWNPAKRLLIYYEDLMSHPLAELKKILTFLKEPTTKCTEFFAQYEAHRAQARQIYKYAISDGNDLLYHSKQLTAKDRKEIDTWIKKRFPQQWQAYLKEKYHE